MTKTYDSLNFENLRNVFEIDGFPKGNGIEDFGNFSEGFCFKLNMLPQTLETYVICCENRVI